MANGLRGFNGLLEGERRPRNFASSCCFAVIRFALVNVSDCYIQPSNTRPSHPRQCSCWDLKSRPSFVTAGRKAFEGEGQVQGSDWQRLCSAAPGEEGQAHTQATG